MHHPDPGPECALPGCDRRYPLAGDGEALTATFTYAPWTAWPPAPTPRTPATASSTPTTARAVGLISDVDNIRKVSKKARQVITSWIG